MSKPKSPCKNCQDRELGCHDRCDKYQAYKEINEKIRAEIRKENEIYGRFIYMRGNKNGMR